MDEKKTMFEANTVTMTLTEFLAYNDAVNQLEEIKDTTYKLIEAGRTYKLEDYLRNKFGFNEEGEA